MKVGDKVTVLKNPQGTWMFDYVGDPGVIAYKDELAESEFGEIYLRVEIETSDGLVSMWMSPEELELRS